MGFEVVTHGLRFSVICGVFPDQGLNLHCTVDSQPVDHQGSPRCEFCWELFPVTCRTQWWREQYLEPRKSWVRILLAFDSLGKLLCFSPNFNVVIYNMGVIMPSS